MTILIGIVVFNFAIGLSLDAKKLKSIFNRPKVLWYAITTQLLIAPLVGFSIYLIASLTNVEYSSMCLLGCLMMSIVGGGTLSNFFCSLSKGNMELSVALTTISGLFVIVVFPIMFVTYCSLLGVDVRSGVTYGSMAQELIIITIPYLIGYLLKEKLKTILNEQVMNVYVKNVKTLCSTVFVVIIIFGNNGNGFDSLTSYDLIASTIMSVGYFLSMLAIALRLTRRLKLSTVYNRAFILETTFQNSGLAYAIVAYKIGNPKVLIPIAIYGMLQVVFGVLYTLYNRKDEVRLAINHLLRFILKGKVFLLCICLGGLMTSAFTVKDNEKVELKIHLHNLQTGGTVYVAVYDSPKTWLTKSPVYRLEKPINSLSINVVLQVAQGTYGYAILEDMNNNGIMDYRFGIPCERYSFSNDSKRKFRAPNFDEALFTLTRSIEHHVWL